MECPNCPGYEMLAHTKNLSFAYGEQPFVVSNVSGRHCAHCGEFILDRADAKRVEQLAQEAKAAGYLTHDESAKG